MRNIELMHKQFGAENGFCRNCSHYKEKWQWDRKYRKCKVYGDSNYEATD